MIKDSDEREVSSSIKEKVTRKVNIFRGFLNEKTIDFKSFKDKIKRKTFQ